MKSMYKEIKQVQLKLSYVAVKQKSRKFYLLCSKFLEAHNCLL